MELPQGPWKHFATKLIRGDGWKRFQNHARRLTGAANQNRDREGADGVPA
jgi:hypothetical protein